MECYCETPNAVEDCVCTKWDSEMTSHQPGRKSIDGVIAERGWWQQDKWVIVLIPVRREALKFEELRGELPCFKTELK